MNAALLPLYVAVPMIVAGFLVGVHLPRPWRAAIMMATLAANVVAAAWLMTRTWDGHAFGHRVGLWDPVIAIPFVADSFAALMLTLTVSVTTVVCLFAIATRDAGEPFFCPLVLLVTAGVNGAILTGDLFNLFVFIEIMLVPSYALIIMAHRGEGKRMQVSASRIYVTVNLLTSTLFLIGVAVVYAALGTVSLGQLLDRGAESPAALMGFLIIMLALGVKAAVLPAHGWLGRTYPYMSATVSALFSALHTKVAVYLIFRITSVVFGDVRVAGALVALLCVSIGVGALGGMGEPDGRAIMSFQMVSGVGHILLGLALFTGAGIAAGIGYMVHHVIVGAALFLVFGAVEAAYGRHPIGEVRGMLWREPLVGVTFLLLALSLVGIPPLSGFVAKFALVKAAFADGQWVAGGLVIAVSVFALMAMLKVWNGMFASGPPEDADSREIPLLVALPAVLLAIASLALGIGGQALLAASHEAARNLTDPSVYALASRGGA